ncbi:MAG TPA: sigma-70 family RNA polymerase sigma factor [Myxococcaceae bacterium]|nr:sigma-70 family RNA polymerase sigma factor [Myxococcaceae bacterium]
MQRCRNGDAGAFRVLVARYERPLYNAAYRVLGNAEDASDVTQVVFMGVAEHLDDFDSERKFYSWIYRIALNAALNLARRNRRDAPPETEDGAGGDPAGSVEAATPESSFGATEQSARLQRGIMQLSADHRAVLTLRHFSGYSYREIGRILSIEERVVKSRLFEARQRLRALLGDLERR